MNQRVWAAQVGSYLWGKQAAEQAAELEIRLRGLAALTGKPYDVVRDQVATLARAGRTDSLAVVSHLEYSHHYAAAQRLRGGTERPKHPSEQRTVLILGRPHHWRRDLTGQLKLVPGESPW